MVHVAVIMDGNGRWAELRGLSRAAGHREGARRVREVVESAPGLGIRTLSLYAFSADNWRRPPREVSALMRLLRAYLASETARLVEHGVRLTVIGRRDRFPATLVNAIAGAEAATREGERLHLRLAVDYSARHALAAAAARPEAWGGREGFSRALGAVLGEPAAAPDVDLLVRTGGEQRLSDFLLWECAYAELLFIPVPWPDFGAAELQAALGEFAGRDRRFGALGRRAAS